MIFHFFKNSLRMSYILLRIIILSDEYIKNKNKLHKIVTEEN